MNQSNRTPWIAAIGGGIVGAALTGVGIILAGPSLFGERLVRDALVSNPEMLVEAGQALQERQHAKSLEPIRAAVERPFFSSWKGAEKPEVTLVYFYDYACPYCHKANPDIERLLKEDKGLRVVYRELPILGPASVDAARVSLAASKAGKFSAFYEALYVAGRPTPESIAIAAREAGVPAQPTEDPAQEAELKSNMTLASQLGATGTPLFVVGDRVINAAVGYDALKEAVAAARKKA